MWGYLPLTSRGKRSGIASGIVHLLAQGGAADHEIAYRQDAGYHGGSSMRPTKRERLMQALNSWEEGLARLGECVVQFQRIEEMLGICISTMIGRSRKVGEIVTSEMSFRGRVSVFGALFRHRLRGRPFPEDVVELLKRLHRAEEERNNLVHSIWDASEAKPETIRREKKAVRKTVFSVAREHRTPDELDDLNRMFEGIVEDLIYLTSEHLPNLDLHQPRSSKS
jgi:hypothetical protein